MRLTDRGVPTDLGAAALAYFDVPDLRALARAVSLRQIGRPQLAGFARVVLDAARLGDPEAKAIVDDAAAALAGLAQLVVEQLGGADLPAVPVAFVGGAMENANLRREVERRIQLATPLARGRGAALGAGHRGGAAGLRCGRHRAPRDLMDLGRLRGLIVSIQPAAASVLNTPETVALLARCAVANGAAGVRIEGAVRIAAVRRGRRASRSSGSSSAPIRASLRTSRRPLRRSRRSPQPVPTSSRSTRPRARVPAASRGGRDRGGSAPWPARDGRLRDGGRTRGRGCGRRAHRGDDAVRLHGRVRAGRTCRPSACCRWRHASGAFAVLEGGVAAPEDVRRAFAAGADAVVVGTAISDIDAQVRRFAQAAAPHRA